MSRSNVYTPQAVLNGRTDVNGADRNAIETGLQKLEGAGQGLSVPFRASVNGKEMDISVGAGKGAGDVVIAYFKRKQTVPIARGENSGKTITYINSVTEVETVGMWKGDAHQLKLPVSVMDMREYDGCAVLSAADRAQWRAWPDPRCCRGHGLDTVNFCRASACILIQVRQTDMEMSSCGVRRLTTNPICSGSEQGQRIRPMS